MDIAATEQLRSLVDFLVEQHGAHVIDLVLRGDTGRRVIEVRIDSVEGATLDQCSAVSRAVMDEIDARELGDGGYRLEVSSPGAERPLKFPWQYRKHVGRQMQVRFLLGQEEVSRTGELIGVDDEGMTLRAGGNAGETRIRFSDVKEATVKVPW